MKEIFMNISGNNLGDNELDLKHLGNSFKSMSSLKKMELYLSYNNLY